MQVDVIGVDACAEDLRAALCELGVQLAKGRDLSGQTKVKSLGQKK